jgi:very-short-patch-repair endonuclease
MNRRKTRASYVIQKNLKASDTSLEKALDEIGEEMGLRLIPMLEINVKHEKVTYTYRPDRRIDETDIILEADGPYHETEIQRRKTQRRDQTLFNELGVRTLHIPGSLLVAEGVGDSRKFWPYVKTKIKAFMESKESWGKILA